MNAFIEWLLMLIALFSALEAAAVEERRWMDDCVRHQQAVVPATVAEPRLHAEGLCVGQRAGERRGFEDDDLGAWMGYYARGYTLTRGTDRELALGIAVGRMDFRERCGEGEDAVGFLYLLGPRDYVMYAERFVDEGEEAAERYLPCTLHQNGEIHVARAFDDAGERYEVRR